jgi:hypothetical protein
MSFVETNLTQIDLLCLEGVELYQDYILGKMIANGFEGSVLDLKYVGKDPK